MKIITHNFSRYKNTLNDLKLCLSKTIEKLGNWGLKILQLSQSHDLIKILSNI